MMNDREEIEIRTGVAIVPFEQNVRIALENFWNGRPLFKGQIPGRIVGDGVLRLVG